VQKLTVAFVAAGLIGIIVSTLLTISSVGNLVTEVSETANSFEESGEVIWEGSSPATFEDDLFATSIYTVLIEDGRQVDVELIGDDGETNTFTPCEVGCSAHEDPGYYVAGTILVSDGGVWKIRFSGDVVGDSDLRIKEYKVPFFAEESVGVLFGVGGCCISIVFLVAGAIVGFSSKQEKVQPVEWVPVSGNN
tara:strand:+ start:496 stop:1074 length:579 start_codon:yes stop_codon:yes gene_type:complete